MNSFSSNTSSAPRSGDATASNIPERQPLRVEYFTKPIALPPSFLAPSPAAGAEPITLTLINFKTTSVPENAGRLAVVLDNVLSASECQTLLSLAEASVDLDRLNAFWKTPELASPWRPAMVNVGQGYEMLEPQYRNSDRIVWDSEEVVGRLWARCLQGEGEALLAMLGVLKGDEHVDVLGDRSNWRRVEAQRQQTWVLRGLNRRMRFLRYGPGQFFRPHFDGNYSEKVDDQVRKTFFTVHVYLNDAKAETGEDATLVGGATSFFADDGSDRKVDVEPKAGRLLIFQQQGLLHAGDDVMEGTKYTMRTEIMYELSKKT